MHILSVLVRWLMVVAFLSALVAPPSSRPASEHRDEASVAIHLGSAKAIERALDQLTAKRVVSSAARLASRAWPPSVPAEARHRRAGMGPLTAARTGARPDLRRDIRRARVASHVPHLGDDDPAGI